MAFALAIEFSDLAAQLTDMETRRFIKDLAVSHHQLIIELLSTRFINQSTASNSDPLNVSCNESISSIIRSRDTGFNSSDINTLDSLPRFLIGHYGSFLDQQSYRALSRCNRSTYLGTNSPNMLKELDIRFPPQSVPEDLPVDLSSFPMANKLILSVPKYQMSRLHYIAKLETIALQIAKMPRLQCLDLLGMEWDPELIEIIANHKTTNENVQYVSMPWGYGPAMGPLTAFKNLQFLHLDIEQDDANATVSEMEAIKQTLRGLKGLKLNDYNSPLGRKLLVAIGHQLEYLELDWIGGEEIINLKTTDFGYLQQFVIGGFCLNDVRRDILKTATNLKKVKIEVKDGDGIDGGIVAEDLEIIAEIIGKCEKLEHFEIEFIECSSNCSRRAEGIWNAINHGLFWSRKHEKKSLRISISADNSEMNLEKGNDLTIQLDRIIHQLLLSNVEQWMVLLRGRGVAPRTDVIKNLIDSLTVDVRILEDKENELTVINNPECTINGYSARWLMS